MFPALQPSRYPNSGLPDEFFKQAHVISSSTEHLPPLPVSVSANCKHACIFVLIQDKFASTFVNSGIINARSIFKDILEAFNLVMRRGMSPTFNNLLAVIGYVASDDAAINSAGASFFNIREERSIFYRFVLETYLAAMLDFILYLYHHNAIAAIADIRIVDIQATQLIIKFDQGII